MTLPLVVQMTVDSGTTYELSADTNLQEIDLDNELQINVVGYDVPEYQGSYTVDAGLSPVVLNTQDKRLTQDVTVNALTENQVTGNSLTINQDNGRVSSLVSISAGYSPVTFGVNKTLQLSTQARATITPTTSEQTAVAKGKYTTGIVKVGAMPTGTAGTPTATKGSVSNHSVSVTPSVTNTTGYIEGGTVTGTPVSVSASELVSGNKAISANGNNIDVANYSTVSVNVPNPSTGTINITENGTVDVTDYRTAEVSVSGGGGKIDDDVLFWDYDGNLLYSYSAKDFATLTEMPPNPTHAGLIAQGWNWTLADAKTQVATSHALDIGQNYVTDDGATRIYISIETDAYPDFVLRIANETSGCTTTIDWGDNSTPTTVTNALANYTHHYSAGDYCISIATTNGGTFKAQGANTYTLLGGGAGTNNSQRRYGAVKRFECGDNMKNLWAYSLRNTGVQTISISTRVQTFSTYSVENVPVDCMIVPSGVTVIPAYAVRGAVISLPKSVTDIQNNSFRQSTIKRFIAHNQLLTIGDSAFYERTSLRKVFLHDNCKIGIQTFYGCSGLDELKIPVPNVGGFIVRGCGKLKRLDLPEGIEIMPSSCCQACGQITVLTIPSTVTSIPAQYNFYQCYSLQELHCLPTTPPTVGNGNFLNSTSSTLVIYVPRGSLTAYQTATNWSTHASKMVEE